MISVMIVGPHDAREGHYSVLLGILKARQIWLTENAPDEHWTANFTNEHSADVVYHFTDPNVALMFKLTWG